MSSDDNIAMLRRLYAEFLDNGDENAADEILDPDIVIHGVAPFGTATGREVIKQGFRMFLSGFDERHTDVEDLVAEGDQIASRHTHHMRHVREALGIPATGKQVAVSGMDIFRIEDGKIAEWWVLDDTLGMLQQLGAIPVPGQPAS